MAPRIFGLIAGAALSSAAIAAADPVALSYGPDPLQKLAYSAPSAKGAPLIVFVHGGAWMFGDMSNATGAKPAFFTSRGYGFATVDYRLAPKVTVADEATDVASAIAALRVRAAALGFDPDRIVLMGHSTGAHLAALIGTDPIYLAKAGVPMAAIRGVVLLDGAGYDVPRQIGEARPILRRLYLRAFGNDPDEQRRLSPTLHAAAPNAGAFLIFHIASRADSAAQSEELAAALRSAGTPARTETVEHRSHRALNQAIGAAGDPTSATILSFLNERLDR